MIFPFESLLAEHRELGLILAVFIGFGFGFVLERAGFGRAKKLAAQFYLYDMTVFKVMFSAIVTSMVGILLLSGLGIADLKAISDYAASGTFLWPMLAGGLLLGVGFIIAGYCPGTSIVSAGSGNVDGLTAFAGVIIGSLLYSEAMDLSPAIANFHASGDVGQLYLYQLLGVPAPVVALAVVLMAVGCFLGAEKVEKIFRKRLEGTSTGVVNTFSNPAGSPAGRFAFATFGVLALAGTATLAIPHGTVTASEGASIGLAELARAVLETPWRLRIIDIRPMEECAASRIPGSECVPVEKLGDLNLQDTPADGDGRTIKTLILVGDGELKNVPDQASRYPGQIRLVSGGFSAWKAFALTAPVFPGAGAPEAALQEFRLRSSLHAALTGMKQAPPPPPTPSSGGGAPRKRSGGGGCSG